MLSRDLIETENKLLDIVQRPVRGRLAQLLMSFSDEGPAGIGLSPIVCSFTRQDLANMIGTVKETVTRVLTEFKNENLITTNGRKIQVINTAGLDRIVNMYEC